MLFALLGRQAGSLEAGMQWDGWPSMALWFDAASSTKKKQKTQMPRHQCKLDMELYVSSMRPA